MFITFEGGEGTGKSTQIRFLEAFFVQMGHGVVVTREPGGTPEAESLRSLLVAGDTDRWSAEAEVLLNFAARDSHLNQRIRPALERGEIVLCDRFVDSTAVYQCFAGGADPKLVDYLTDSIVGSTMPNLTIVLDLDPAIGIPRSRNRMAQYKISSEKLVEEGRRQNSDFAIDLGHAVKDMSNEDRFERKDFAFHTRVREGFQRIVELFPSRCALIDGSESELLVHERIKIELVRRGLG